MRSHDANKRNSRFKLMKTYSFIEAEPLKMEIDRRKISYELANQYYQQAFIYDRRTHIKSLGFAFRNEAKGFQIVIPQPQSGKSLKSLIGKPCYTFYKGEHTHHVEIFKSQWDYLSWLTITKRNRPKFDSYVLNGFGNVPQLLNELEQKESEIKSIVDFMPNCATGGYASEALESFSEEKGFRYGVQSYIFNGNNDLSEFWMNCQDTDQFIATIHN